jgi:hypothetical protein
VFTLEVLSLLSMFLATPSSYCPHFLDRRLFHFGADPLKAGNGWLDGCLPVRNTPCGGI